MNRILKRAIFVVAGFCWFSFALLFCLLLLGFLCGGAGLQTFSFLLPVSSTSVLTGLVHFFGFLTGACLCFAIGAGLFAHGVTLPRDQPKEEKPGEIDEAQ